MRLVLASSLVGALAIGTAPFGLLSGAEAGDDAPTPGGDEPLPEAPGDDIPSTPGADEPLPAAPFLTLTPNEGDPGTPIQAQGGCRTVNGMNWDTGGGWVWVHWGDPPAWDSLNAGLDFPPDPWTVGGAPGTDPVVPDGTLPGIYPVRAICFPAFVGNASDAWVIYAPFTVSPPESIVPWSWAVAYPVTVVTAIVRDGFTRVGLPTQPIGDPPTVTTTTTTPTTPSPTAPTVPTTTTSRPTPTTTDRTTTTSTRR